MKVEIVYVEKEIPIVDNSHIKKLLNKGYYVVKIEPRIKQVLVNGEYTLIEYNKVELRYNLLKDFLDKSYQIYKRIRRL
jgi:hypothetical protein